MTPLAHLIALPIRAYRLVASPWVGHGCRFLPSCSAYALEALEQHGGLRGGWLTARRICRCHPWGGQGHDPVPSARPRRAAGAGCAGPGPEDDGHALTAGADDERA